jgi:hypothetical protein
MWLGHRLRVVENQ